MRAVNLRLKSEQDVIAAARALVEVRRCNPTATFTPASLGMLAGAVERLERFHLRPDVAVVDRSRMLEELVDSVARWSADGHDRRLSGVLDAFNTIVEYDSGRPA